MNNQQVQLRPAAAADAEIVHRFIVELAVYEKDPDAVEATPESLRAQLASDPPPFECLLAEIEEEPLGMALFFTSYSTWRGRTGIYLEDLFVPERHRGLGVGAALLSELARITLRRGGGRLEWAVLDWNEPALGFYRRLGARTMDDWVPHRLDGPALEALATGKEPPARP